MTDEFSDNYSDDDNEQANYGDNPNIRQLREKAKKFDAVAAERDMARRELAFHKAGIPDSKVGQLFMKAYDGDVDTEAIRAAAAEYGLVEAEVPGEEPDAMERIEQVAAGGTPPPQTTDFNSMIRAAAGHRPN